VLIESSAGKCLHFSTNAKPSSAQSEAAYREHSLEPSCTEPCLVSVLLSQSVLSSALPTGPSASHAAVALRLVSGWALQEVYFPSPHSLNLWKAMFEQHTEKTALSPLGLNRALSVSCLVRIPSPALFRKAWSAAHAAAASSSEADVRAGLCRRCSSAACTPAAADA
jgi:hypothetical protein